MTMRDASAFAMAYEVVLPEAEALKRMLAHTIRAAKASAGESALDALRDRAAAGEGASVGHYRLCHRCRLAHHEHSSGSACHT